MIKTTSSTAVKGFSYSDGMLKVKYKQGTNYVYENVSQGDFQALKSCESTGKMLNKLKKTHKCYKEL